MKTINNNVDAYCLVVVDMQPLFTKQRQTVDNVEREVIGARASNCPVFFLEIEYDELEPHIPYGDTHKCLLDAVEGYELAHICRRIGRRLPAEKVSVSWTRPKVPGQDGSAGVTKMCKRLGYPMNRFRVCGVQADLCVLSSVKGLLRRTEGKVEVVEDATNTIAHMQRFWRAKFPEGKRLKLV